VILLLSARLLDDCFHGLAANGERPNWPPSCFRLFQAIVAGNARGESIPPEVIEALKWLEALPPPVVVVPASRAGKVTLTYVLNNTEGRSRTQKILRPTLLNGDHLIEFAWQYDPSESGAQDHARVLLDAVRHIRAFGWGIDLAIGHGVIHERLPEPSESRVHFFPREHSDAPGIEVRVPKVGSMDSLTECFRQYLSRFKSSDSTFLESGGPLYEPWPYTAGIPRPYAVFKLLDKDGEPARYSHARLVHIAGMVRNLAINQLKGNKPSWKRDDPQWLETFVCGHRGNQEQHQQISYVPLPSIGHEHADAMIRNVMLIAPVGCERELEYVAGRINDRPVNPEHQVQSDAPATTSRRFEPASIERFNPPRGKFIDKYYFGTSSVWHTVTPVILDGHNDKKAGKTIKLIQTALTRAGIETPCYFTWQAIPFLKNCLSAHKYDRSGRHTGYHRPAHLKDRTAVHVRLTFEHPVPGPLAIGAGRHCGLGTFAAEPDA
jgi:CRISPR-associated protein Csb2